MRMVNGDQIKVSVPSLDISVGELKTIVEAASKIPVPQQRLIFSGHVLKDEQKLTAAGVC
jgi:hypothetical protein